MKQAITENRLKYWARLRGRKLSPEHRLKVIKTLKPIRKGGTYEEAFGTEIAKQMREKMSLAKTGRKMPWNSVPDRVEEKSPRWIKDRTQVIGRHNRSFHDTAIKQWKKEVHLRDKYKCRMENNECSGRLEAHHILTWKDYPKLRYIITNGISLCHAHHPRSRAEEKRLSNYFKQLLDNVSIKE